jgi:hypothetical protein
VVEDHNAKVEKVLREQHEGNPPVGKTEGWIYHHEYVENASDTSDRQKDGQGEVEEEDDSEPPRGSQLEVDQGEVSVTCEEVGFIPSGLGRNSVIM